MFDVGLIGGANQPLPVTLRTATWRQQYCRVSLKVLNEVSVLLM